MLQSAPDESYLVELSDGVLRLSFNRPQYGNAIPKTTVPQLTGLFQAAQADPAVRCILVRGEGKVFSAGGDVASFADSIKQDVATRQADFAHRLPLARELVEAIVAFDRPIVASVRGSQGVKALDNRRAYFSVAKSAWASGDHSYVWPRSSAAMSSLRASPRRPALASTVARW